MFTFDLNHEHATHYGIVNISVANMRRQPVFQAEIVNQTLLGTILPIFEQQNDFCFVKNWDNYKGWLTATSLRQVSREQAAEWAAKPKAIFAGNYGRVTQAIDSGSDTITDLTTCCLLTERNRISGTTEVELPDGRIGFVSSELLVSPETQAKVSCTPEEIVKLAKRFLGIPYLWGGTSSKAFDCSGFVQTVFRLLNKNLPRNASQMARLGEGITPASDFSNLKIGDLLIYGKSVERITHVSIYIGEGRYIHADGAVRINSLLPDATDFNQKRRDSVLMVRRII